MQLITRGEWGARPPRNTSSITPRGVAVHWEGPHMGSFDHGQCADKVRGIQAFHMDRNGWADIAYNALVCPHGAVFEGRGRGIRSAANGTNAANSAFVAVCFLSGQGDPFTAEAATGVNDAADWLGVGAGSWTGHRDHFGTACPGDEIYNWVQSGHPRGAGAPPAPRPTPEPTQGPPWPGRLLRYPPLTVGDDVRIWQGRMAERGWRIGVDGQYGPQAAEVCKAFQREKGLEVDGIVGERTWGAAWQSPVTVGMLPV